jgi:hypothetical protein
VPGSLCRAARFSWNIRICNHAPNFDRRCVVVNQAREIDKWVQM